MKREIYWPIPTGGEPASPFENGRIERNLKITFHTGPFVLQDRKYQEATEILGELTNLPNIQRMAIPYQDLVNMDGYSSRPEMDFISVKATKEEGDATIYVPRPNQWLNTARGLANDYGIENDEVGMMFNDIIVAQAHRQMGYDILVTQSERLYANRDNNLLRNVNICTPLEAIKIIGLYLRIKGIFTIDVKSNCTTNLNRGLFYLLLARHRLPRMWKYYSACVESAKSQNNGIQKLAGSVLVRCERALEACDFIGGQFHRRQGNDTRDIMMYHFDYLTLLLLGALDAQAHVARIVYGIKKPSERHTNFRNKEFNSALRKFNALDLAEIVMSEKFADLLTLLVTLRNTIHYSCFQTSAVKEPVKQEYSRVILGPHDFERIWNAAKRLGNPDDWGLSRGRRIAFEPYSYACTLTNECFRFINNIAGATDVSRLWPHNTIPKLLCQPPKTDVFRRDIRKRVHLLG